MSILSRLLKRRRPIYLCHGCFDPLHVGHLAHLAEAGRTAHKAGGVLLVSVTADEFVNKGPGRPFMPDVERVRIISSLKMVDHARLNWAPTAVPLLKSLKPYRYIKGMDRTFQSNVGPDLMAEIAAVREGGGDILYTTTLVRHSTDYLERYRTAFHN